jgi:hypothetical protein
MTADEARARRLAARREREARANEQRANTARRVVTDKLAERVWAKHALPDYYPPPAARKKSEVWP